MSELANAINSTVLEAHRELDKTKTSSTVNQTEEGSYFAIQIKLAIFVFFFWSLCVCCTYFRDEIYLMRPQFLNSIINKILLFPQIRKAIDLKDSLLTVIFNFDIRKIQAVIRSTSRTLSTIIQTILSTRPKYNLSQLINYIKSTILNFHNISKSLSQISSSALHGVKKILSLPGNIKGAIQNITKEISKFWKFIEQIVQIIRLPIEILKAISQFVLNIAAFMSRLQRPKIKI